MISLADKVKQAGVVGADDFICSPAAARRVHLALPNSKLLVIEKCGHFPWMEQPEEFSTQVLVFLKALGLRPVESQAIDAMARQFGG